MAATGHRNLGMQTAHQLHKTSMVRYLHGIDEKNFPWVAHLGVLKLPQLEMYWSMYIPMIYIRSMLCTKYIV